jgi:pimeloyl-ACP methyl ester carboxylesterase
MDRFGDVNVVFDSKNRIAGLNYTYNKTYSEDDVSFDVLFGTEYTLPGSLIVPEAEVPLPAVIIVHGSGPSDRNGEVGGSAVYYDIAIGLEEAGIASLRYDKRTYVYYEDSDYDMQSFTVYDETIDDVVKAFEFLRLQQGIDPDRIYIAGHSLGGYLIPRIAEELPDAAGFIMLAPNASPLEDLMVVQTEYIYGLDGRLTQTEKNSIRVIEETAEIIKNLKPGDNYEVAELFNAPVSYWLDLQEYRPLQEIKLVGKPVLIIHGERDYQVNTSEYKKWQIAVADMINADSILIPGLNHMLAYGEEQSTPQEYYQLSEVDSSVMTLMAEFILGN